MMVDNSIIVIDNITARWIRGEQLAGAVTQGTKEVMVPMLSSVLTTCAVFVPLIFLNGMAGALFYDQAMAVAITLFVAYGVSVTLLPVYYRWWYSRQQAFRPTPVARVLLLRPDHRQVRRHPEMVFPPSRADVGHLCRRGTGAGGTLLGDRQGTGCRR